MIEVYEKKKIPENCSTCLYDGGFGCGHADRRDDWFKMVFSKQIDEAEIKESANSFLETLFKVLLENQKDNKNLDKTE